jgi:hypothetical protein
MSQNSGPFLVSSHGHPAFNPRAVPPPPPSSSSTISSSKRNSNGLMSGTNAGNPSINSNMAVGSSPSQMRSGGSMGPMKPGTGSLGPMEKSNSMPYPSRYNRKAWPIARSINGKY